MAPKNKAQKMSMSTFLADESLGSWADEMEDMPLPSTQPLSSTFNRRPMGDMGYGSSSGGFERERGGYAVREPLDLPTQPPYTCHVGNLSFEATEADISELFAGCGVTNVRVVEDKLTKAPKGFGYVEFETVEGLQKALDLSGSSLQGRSIRTSVAEPPKESRMEGKDLDWSRRGPLPDIPQRRVPERSSFGRGMDAGSDAGSERGGRRSNFESDGKPRDFNNWERKGPLSPSAGAPREGGRSNSTEGAGPGSSFRRNEAAWGEGRSQDEGSRPPRPEHVRPEPTPTAADMDNQWRARMRPDETPKEPTSPASPSATPAVPVAPAGRPKLNLTKRTVSENPSVATSAGSDSKASPFGAARPIDTATRERQVEERRQLAIRQKQEAAEKAKAEKAEKFAEKQKQAKDAAPAVDHNGKDVLETPRGGGNFEVLQRAGEDGDMATDKEAEETAAAAPAEAKKEIANGWRTPAAEAGAGGDDEGWSTVSVNKRNNRRGQTGRGFA
ncbi:hypothetical protein N7457_004306 [Penicillium paradoxum]|uniref:uncharacterized protein n=1 Tax=Penicillium paradoxum TaxID=176176 RepID=UPI002547299B|nr:uncharacterized protein N7457_004306 [Penicillium paradoxum]KAJ5782532.1 hypothetical protein N7457_004306 [Penicillium paradoxum]